MNLQIVLRYVSPHYGDLQYASALQAKASST